MTEQDHPNHPASPLPGPRGWSTESLLASLLLHLAVLLGVILFAPRGGSDHHDGVVVDIGSFTLPAPRAAPEPAAPPPDTEDGIAVPSVAATFKPEEPEAEAPSPAGEEVPSEPPPPEEPVTEAPAPDPAPPEVEEVASEPPPPEDPVAEAPESAAEAPGEAVAEAGAAHPPIPEVALPHELGPYDPFEAYKAALAQRVHDLTASVEFLPARTLFVGKLAVHLYLDPDGWHREDPKVCLGHSDIYLAAMMPGPVAQRHFQVLVHGVVNALTTGAPFPPAPPGIEIPRELTTFIALDGN